MGLIIPNETGAGSKSAREAGLNQTGMTLMVVIPVKAHGQPGNPVGFEII
jgi:hypothetical protein